MSLIDWRHLPAIHQHFKYATRIAINNESILRLIQFKNFSQVSVFHHNLNQLLRLDAVSINPGLETENYIDRACIDIDDFLTHFISPVSASH
jgi:hypothetical protein